MSGTATRILVPADAAEPRHSEASAVRLADGRILLAWSAFAATAAPPPGTETDDPTAREWAHSRDNDPARIDALVSSDDGATWTDRRTLVPHGGGINIMQPAFARLPDGGLALSYSDRTSRSLSRRLFVRSDDEGATWTKPVDVTGVDGYVTASNDRLIVLRSGRLVQPMHQLLGESIAAFVAYPDDAGRTWAHSARLELPHPVADALYGFWEASVAELDDGSLLLMGRTVLGEVYGSRSRDGGRSWSEPSPTGVTAPSAPSLLRATSDGRLLLFHNTEYRAGELMQGPRSPLVLSSSADGGAGWQVLARMESAADRWFHYPSCLVEGDRAFVTDSVTDPATREGSLAGRWVELGGGWSWALLRRARLSTRTSRRRARRTPRRSPAAAGRCRRTTTIRSAAAAGRRSRASSS
jgi:hypothetical protein